MPLLKHILFLSTTLTLFACSQPARQEKTLVDWNDELLGFGHLSDSLETIGKQVMFVPNDKQHLWRRMMYDFHFQRLMISGDTLTLNKYFVADNLFRPIELRGEPWSNYLVKKMFFNVFVFAKLKGEKSWPSVLFYQPFSSRRDRKFQYLFIARKGDIGRNTNFIEIGEHGLVFLFDWDYINSKYRVLILKNQSDIKVVNQLIQHTIANRGDTVNIENFCGDVYTTTQVLVHNNEIYEHNSRSKWDMLDYEIFTYFEGHPNWIEVKDSAQIEYLLNKKAKVFLNYPTVIKAPDLRYLGPPPVPEF